MVSVLERVDCRSREEMIIKDNMYSCLNNVSYQSTITYMGLESVKKLWPCFFFLLKIKLKNKKTLTKVHIVPFIT